MSFREVQNILDENTDNVPEGLYLQLSKALMNAHHSRNKEIEETMGRFADTITRTVLASTGDEVLNEIVTLKCQVDFLREKLFESDLQVSRLKERNTIYRQHVSNSSKKNEEYKKKIKELEVMLSLKEQEKNEILRTTTKCEPEPKENKWIRHVWDWAETHGINYAQALKSQECRQDYRSKK